MEWIVKSPDELPALVEPLLKALGARRKIALYGEMGAGKTTLVKAICQYLGVRENTASPTFSLVNQYSYTAPDGSISFFHHLDLYRLRSVQEAFDIGLEDILYDPWYCVIEWPQWAELLLPEDAVSLEIEILGERERRIHVGRNEFRQQQ
ncbi:MAG: tRNA (adenosine(37)-N6)-threonylcarbamoyltransferase complex ATPase subunit type 1 TsaE [Saprospiraceae bacterium]